MNVLTIGNSFSQDATRYLSAAAKAQGINITVVNLCIGGCPLSLHYRNMLSDDKAYSLEFNGVGTGFKMSLSEALLSRDWDYISIQQVSNLSVKYDTFQPYITELAEYIRTCSPKAKLLIHQTWAYEQGSDRLHNSMKFEHRKDMLKCIIDSYSNAAKDVNAYKIIPSGEMFDSLLDNGIKSVHRDTFHASLGLGRYALALLWIRALTGADILQNSFSQFDEEITEQDIKIIKDCVTKII